MDESRHPERRAFRRRSFVAFAASIALHCVFFALLFCIAVAPPGATSPLAISLLGGESGGAGIASRSAPHPSLQGSDGAGRTNAGGNEIRDRSQSDSHGDSQSDPPVDGAAGSEKEVDGIDGHRGAAEPGPGNTSARGGGDQTAALAAQVLAAVEARKAYPDAARRRGTEGTVRLRFSVAEDGRLLAAKIVASSGSALLDRAALDLFASVFPVDNAARREIDDLMLSISYGLKR